MASYHLNIIQPEIRQRPLYLDMVQDDHLMHNSIIGDCFYGETSRLNLRRYTSKDDFRTPGKPFRPLEFHRNCFLFFCISCKQKKRLHFYKVIPKVQIVISAAIKSKIYNIWTVNIKVV